jgi:hypothetical protein
MNTDTRESRRGFRHDVWSAYEGKCFYCFAPTMKDGATYDGRDWLLSRDHEFAQEHVTPIIRGGSEDPSNFVPSCRKCNTLKGSLTLEEYRLLCGLRRGNPDFRFPMQGPPAQLRDWLCCHSKTFEHDLLKHNCARLQ